MVDNNGLWPTGKYGSPKVHQNSIARTLDNFFSPEDILILQGQQAIMDADESLEGAFKHAMSAPGQPAWYARFLAENFVRNEITAAQDCEHAGGRSNHIIAMQHLGNAMHTLQDATSPSHKGFQTWYGEYHLSAISHVLGENYDPGPGSDLDQATIQAWGYFQGLISMKGIF